MLPDAPVLKGSSAPPPPPEPPAEAPVFIVGLFPPLPPPAEVIVVNPEPDIEEFEPANEVVDGLAIPPAPPSPTVTVITFVPVIV